MNFKGFQKTNLRSLANLLYAPILAFAMGLMLLRIIVAARLLSVPDFAAYSAGLLVSSSFCMLSCFGLAWLLQRDLPIMIVRGRERAGGILLIQCAIVTVLSALVGLLFLFAIDVSLVGLTTIGLCVALFHGASQQLFTIATTDSRSRNLPLRFAFQNIERAVATALAGPAVIWLGGEAQAILAVEALLTIALSSRLLIKKFRSDQFAIGSALRLGWTRLPRVEWESALTLLAVSALSFVILSSDRWIATQWLSANLFGQYAFAWTLFTIAQSVHQIINSSAYPLLSQRYAIHGITASFKFAMILSTSSFILSVIFSLPAYFMLGCVVDVYFPEYDNVIDIIPIFLLAVSFRVSDFWTSFMIVARHERKITYILVANMFLAMFLWMIYLNFDVNRIQINSIAVLALTLSFTNYVVLAFFSWKALTQDRRVALRRSL